MQPPRTQDRERLEQLLEDIDCGNYESVEQIEERDLELLREYYGNPADLQAVLDKVGQGGAEAR